MHKPKKIGEGILEQQMFHDLEALRRQAMRRMSKNEARRGAGRGGTAGEETARSDQRKDLM